MLRQLKDQGERIRFDTIALLKNKMSAGYVEPAYNPQDSYPIVGYPPAGYGNTQGASTGGYTVPGMPSGQRAGGITAEQQAMFRAQLNELRMECEQLQQENANIKRISKGTNYTNGSRKY